MKLIRVCPRCYRGTPDVTLEFCIDDGVHLSEPFPIPLREVDLEDAEEVETVVRAVNNQIAQPHQAAQSSADPRKRMRANSKQFITANHPDLLGYKRRSSRMWENADPPCWWFGLMEYDLDHNEYIVFAGALDTVNEDFKLLKVPTSYIKENIEKVDKTSDGWINIYLDMSRFVDVRNEAGLSFRQFVVN